MLDLPTSIEELDRPVDKEYLQLLEKKLESVKNPTGEKATVKAFLSDIASVKDHQLFNLITSDVVEEKFEDNFVDQVITPSYLKRKVAPQRCAISVVETLPLVKNDLTQKVFESWPEEPAKTDGGWAEFDKFTPEKKEKKQKED